MPLIRTHPVSLAAKRHGAQFSPSCTLLGAYHGARTAPESNDVSGYDWCCWEDSLEEFNAIHCYHAPLGKTIWL